jgi:hypothetical protein
MAAVKLQVLLRRRLQPNELREVERGLAAIGATVTGRGAITLSATMPVERFEEIFGRPFSGRFGFTADVRSAEDLPVPKRLAGWVDSISETPPHQRKYETPEGGPDEHL